MSEVLLYAFPAVKALCEDMLNLHAPPQLRFRTRPVGVHEARPGECKVPILKGEDYTFRVISITRSHTFEQSVCGRSI